MYVRGGPLHSRPFRLSFLVKDNSHSYTHLILALGIVREPIVWGLLLQNIYLTRNKSQKGREWRGPWDCGYLGPYRHIDEHIANPFVPTRARARRSRILALYPPTLDPTFQWVVSSSERVKRVHVNTFQQSRYPSTVAPAVPVSTRTRSP